jgi:hypothetical protein
LEDQPAELRSAQGRLNTAAHHDELSLFGEAEETEPEGLRRIDLKAQQIAELAVTA